jgi:hypothetical protein
MSSGTLSIVPVLVSAAESETSGINPWAVGAAVLALLVLAVFGLLAFGAGREHS